MEPTDTKETDRAHQMVEGLLLKPSKKPDFKNQISGLLQQGSALHKAKAFMPSFIQQTDKLLSCPDYAREHQMDIQILEGE